MHKQAAEHMLESEIYAHLDNEKHDKKGYRELSQRTWDQEKIKTSFSQQEIKVPPDRDASFNPMLVPKRENVLNCCYIALC
jgi:putative transposase